VWFGVLCHGLGSDTAGQITLQAVFNQVAFLNPPDEIGLPPNAFLNAVLAVGFSGGLGHFEADITLRDSDENVLWRRPEGLWSFQLGPGEKNSAILAQQIQYWFTQPGQYHFLIHLSPSQAEHPILFEVAERIGPAELASDASPEVSR